MKPSVVDVADERVGTVPSGKSATCTVAALACDAAPLALVAVTSNLRYLPTSLSVSVYVADVAPAMSLYVPDADDARRHLNVYDGVGYPVQVPCAPVRISPLRTVPLTVGAAVLAGTESAK